MPSGAAEAATGRPGQLGGRVGCCSSLISAVRVLVNRALLEHFQQRPHRASSTKLKGATYVAV